MLPLSIEGLPLHTRTLSVVISRSGAGSWLARGDVIDLRKNGLVPSTYDLQPSGIIHSMSIELDLDPETLTIDGIRLQQPFVAIEAAPETGGECCRDPAPRLLALQGETLDDGFGRRLGAVFGGPRGCSHLQTLFQLMASTIPRAAALERARAAQEGTTPRIHERFFRRSLFLDGHDRDDGTLDVAIQLTDTHSRPVGPRDGAIARLALSHEIKLHARVDRKRFRIQTISARERSRTPETLGTAPWTNHDERIACLVGVPLIPGLAARIFALTGPDPLARPLRDVLLQLAPGFIQVMAALMDAYYEERARKPSNEVVEPPAVANLGGNQNSCYMWRTDGFILRSRAVRDAAPDRPDVPGSPELPE